MQKIPQEQFDEYKQIFSLFDRDGDGQINVSELGTLLRAVGRLPSDAELRDLKESLSTATFSFADFLAAISKLPAADASTLRAALMDAFRVFDQAGSGEIGTSQLQHIMTSIGEKLSEEESQELVKMADPAGTGVVRYEVFVDKLISQ